MTAEEMMKEICFFYVGSKKNLFKQILMLSAQAQKRPLIIHTWNFQTREKKQVYSAFAPMSSL